MGLLVEILNLKAGAPLAPKTLFSLVLQVPELILSIKLERAEFLISPNKTPISSLQMEAEPLDIHYQAESGNEKKT